MKIAFLTSEFPHPKTGSAGGIGTTIDNLAKGLKAQGQEVVVLIYGQDQDGFFESDGTAVYRIKNVKFKGLSWYLTRKKIQRLANKLYTEQKIDILEAPDWTGITAFMNLKMPLVVRFHGTDAYFCRLEGRKQKFMNYVLEKNAIRNADALVSPTRFAAEVTREIFKIGKAVSVIPSGLPLPDFVNNDPEDFERGLILYIGTLIRKKGVFELPGILKQAVADFPEAKLIMVGSDSADIQTQSKSTWQLVQDTIDENLKNKISYLGKVSYFEVRNLIKSAHVCVFPTFAETQGMVTIESMAMQKPVVNSNFGWAKEIIEDGKSGFLADPKNHKAFADKIVSLMQNDTLRQSICHGAAKKVAEDFDIVSIAARNIAFYEAVLKDKK